MYFYAMRHKVTNKVYVGCTEGYSIRIADHMGNLKRGTHPNKLMQRDCDKYGIDFDLFLLEEDDYDKPTWREREWQTMLKSNDERYGYNVLADGEADFNINLDNFPKINQTGKATFKAEKRDADKVLDKVIGLCKEKGIDPDYLRKICGLTKTEFRNLILFNGALRYAGIAKIAKALGVNTGDLLWGVL